MWLPSLFFLLLRCLLQAENFQIAILAVMDTMMVAVIVATIAVAMVGIVRITVVVYGAAAMEEHRGIRNNCDNRFHNRLSIWKGSVKFG